jgi:hypothetical protein
MEDNFEFNEIANIIDQEKSKKLKTDKQIKGFTMLFNHWLDHGNIYGKSVAKRIYLYFKENHNLHQMLSTFEKIEDYEKCAIISEWLKEIQELEKADRKKYEM